VLTGSLPITGSETSSTISTSATANNTTMPNNPTASVASTTAGTTTVPSAVHLLKTPERRLKLTLRMKRSPIIDDLIECGTSLSDESSNNYFEPEYEILRVEGLMTDNEMMPPTADDDGLMNGDDADSDGGGSSLVTRRHKKSHKSKQRRKRKRHEKNHSDNEYATSLLNFKHHHRSSPLKSSTSLFSHPLPPSPPMKRLRLIFGNETHTIDIPTISSAVATTSSHGP
jgi:[histone H4]-N-methyl-L-lysine20 N-methyltransferase